MHPNNPDSIPLIKEMLFRDEAAQSYAVFNGMCCECIQKPQSEVIRAILRCKSAFKNRNPR